MGMFKALFGTYSEREVKRIKPLVDKIESLDSTMGELSEEQLKAKTGEFRERYKNGESLDDLLPEAFAVVREASWRVLKMKHYREQLIGGIVLHQGRIAEMKTGEGKTLVATLPAYLNAISGEGVHVITVNDYLASRTPLIISGAGEKSTEFYKVADYFVKTLIAEEDYTIDEKANAVMLTDKGIEKAEKAFKVENYADAENMQLQHYVTQALKANYFMKLDKDYMVKDGEVIIVDEFTGRLMEGRRYSDGLHQAIEAKEGVKIARESKTLATITFQNYFRMYNKLSGMTGTALTEENEFREIYGLDVIVIPTHRPIQRVDNHDIVYKTAKGKYNAIVEEIKKAHAKGQPVLVGTASIEKSEIISALLKKQGIKHKVLNAKYHEQEAEIIADAGEVNSVTIATNMAGRGTDIKLGEGALEAGGLKIIGTERHESRRIDNQLRGRSGRQGDIGESTFFISLEDDLMRIFMSEKTHAMVDKLGLEDDDAIESKIITRSIESAQKKVEGHNFDIRKNLLGYDDVMNMQREIIYKQRAQVLEGENLKEQIEEMIKEVISAAVDTHITGMEEDYKTEFKNLILYLDDICLPANRVTIDDLVNLSNEEIKEKLINLSLEIYNGKEAEFGEEKLREIERVVLLKNVDTKWMDHIDNMDHLKQGIGLRAFKQQDPVQAYQMEGSAMFEEMIESIKVDTVKYLFHVQMEKAPERELLKKQQLFMKDQEMLQRKRNQLRKQ